MTTLSFIVACTQNYVIGKNQTMPWHLPRDFAWFKEKTLGKTIIMGRKTFESIGKPLPHRTNVVLSRSPFQHNGVVWQPSLEQALAGACDEQEVMLIGGGELFHTYLPQANRIYLTQIQTVLAGDVFFPELDFSQWEVKEEKWYKKDENNAYDLRFLVLDRKQGERSSCHTKA